MDDLKLPAPVLPAAVAPVPAEVPFSEFIAEERIDEGRARHVMHVHQLTRASRATPERFRDLVTAAHKARI